MSAGAHGIILAAGKGTRMKSSLPKCLHEVCGVPMVRLVLQEMTKAGIGRSVVVVGHGAGEMREHLGESCDYALQQDQNGTGHAVQMAKEAFRGVSGRVVVACGDVPLVRAETIQKLLDTQEEHGAHCVLATVIVEEPKGYGRIIRSGSNVCAIVEEKDATADERSVKEINPALYCFDIETLFRVLEHVEPSPVTGEIYLTEVIRLIHEEGGKVIGVVFDDVAEFVGVNDRWQLAQVSKTLRMRIVREHSLNGVTIIDPDSTFIGGDVKIDTDTTIQPMTVLEGKTTIGSGCSIGPNTWVKSSQIGNGVRIFMSHLDQARMDDGSRCGPFANLRPDSHLGEEVKVGNFVEIKKSKIGKKTSISHLTYIGDAFVGERSNIGAGTITCNYDGYSKHITEIGDDVFVGSNSTLVAPVAIGNGAMTAAGSVVTQDIPTESLGIGRSRQENKEGWAAKWRDKKTRTE